MSRECEEFLALHVKNGKSIYYSGTFAASNSEVITLKDLKEKSVALGDVSSTSLFNIPVAMMIDAGLDPAKYLGKIIMAGSHTNALTALRENRVDGACASFNIFETSVQKGIIDPTKIRVLAKSEPIPVPFMGMHINYLLKLNYRE